MAKTAFAFKIHTYTTDAGHQPATGTPSADFRGDLWVGSPQGDEHHCIFAVKSLDDSIVSALLLALPAVNAAILSGETSVLGELHLPTEVGGILSAIGSIPNIRLGIWDNDR